jgi:rhodanese-related sulfurtransferase/Fe-S cluster assembly iron-binding protein IscA/glutaredoxin-related protein
MSDRVLSRLKALTATDEIVVFCAGCDPLSPKTKYLVDWLEERGAKFLVVDAMSDPVLSPLLEAGRTHQCLPILCADGRLIGAGAVLRHLAESGQLAHLLGKPSASRIPVIAASTRAATVLQSALQTATDVIRLKISRALQHELDVDERRADDVELTLGNVTLVLDRDSAALADGLAIDWIERTEGSGFRIDNPNEPRGLRQVECDVLAQRLDSPLPPLLIDARTEGEYLRERLPNARLLDASLLDALPLLDRRTPLAFYCKNGTRSQRAALHHVELGFLDVVMLAGGLDAWTQCFGH